MTKIAIIVAGGKGERMQSDIPKQFIEIQNKPILMHTLEVFYKYDASLRIILVLPAQQLVFWNQLCKKHAFAIEHKIVEGGKTRFHSVKNALVFIVDQSVIAFHDGVRPLVNTETIARCFAAAESFGAAIPVISLIDSIRQTDGQNSVSVDRSAYKLVQTPQVFTSDILIKAYEQEFSALFTDDASVVESAGTKVQLVEGNRDNIKITTEMDLRIAEVLFSNLKN